MEPAPDPSPASEPKAGRHVQAIIGRQRHIRQRHGQRRSPGAPDWRRSAGGAGGSRLHAPCCGNQPADARTAVGRVCKVTGQRHRDGPARAGTVTLSVRV